MAVDHSRLTPKETASGLGVSLSNLYVLYKKKTFSIEYARKASELLNQPLNYFLDEESAVIDESLDDYSKDDRTLLQEIRNEVKMLREQLQAKDRQIADLQQTSSSLQRTLEVLAVKSEGVIADLLSTDDEEFMVKFNQYRKAAISHLLGKPSPKRKSSSGKVSGTPLALVAN